MDKLQNALDALKARLPLAGILAFALCSTWSVFNLLHAHAVHPTALYWLPAVLVELVTAWTVAQVVGQVRELTRSKLSKQDRRFYAIITAAFVLVALPLVALSVWANSLEFGSVLLGLIFPLACMGCAVGAALPDVTATHRQRAASERKRKASERKRKASKRQAELARVQGLSNLVASLGKAGATLALYAERPLLSQSKAALELGISRQAVGQHLAKLESDGVIKRNGRGVEVLV